VVHVNRVFQDLRKLGVRSATSRTIEFVNRDEALCSSTCERRETGKPGTGILSTNQPSLSHTVGSPRHASRRNSVCRAGTNIGKPTWMSRRGQFSGTER
jgi:hypothetical protein